MTVYNELSKIAYIGSIEQTLYPIPFEYIDTDDIKVSVYTSNNEFVEDWTYSTQYVIEGGNVKVLSGYNIDNTKKLLVLRRVDLIQDNKYREGGDFPAKSTETSFDKLTMITQQLQETLDRCVKVEVLDIQTPEELLQAVYDKLDSATEIAGDAINAANQAQTAADNATAAVNSAEQTLVQTQAYVDAAKVEINNTKNTAVETINSTVSNAKSDINTSIDEATMNITDIVSNAEGSITNIAVTEANKAIANAAQEATDIATANVNNYVDGTVKPSLQTYVDKAQADANSAAISMEQAALSATAASEYASNASADADNAAESASQAANSAIWAEGTDSEVQRLGGVHSSKVWSEIAQTAIEDPSRVTNVVSSLPNHVNVVTDVETRTDIYYGWTVEGSRGVQKPLYTTTETLVEGTILYTGAGVPELFVVESVEAVDDYFMVTVDLGPLYKFTRNTDYDTSYSYNVKLIKLKAGSRVHFPNGNYVDITEDKSVEYPRADTGDYYLYTSGENNNLMWVPVAYTFTDNVQRSHISGAKYLYGLWYDTDTNILKETQDNRQHWNDNNVSLPVCIFRYQTNNPQIYIKKIFKDYGHLAGLLFALPNINGKAPSGKNPDGTINTIDYTLPTVSTLLVGNTSTDTGVTASSDVALSADGSLVADTFTLKDDNYLYNSSDALVSGFECCSYSVSDGRVTSLDVKQPYKLYDSDKIDEKFVHKDLDETITGQKLISNDGQNSHVVNEGNSQLDIYCTNIDSSIVPGSRKYAGITLCDKNGIRMGKLEVSHSSSDVIICSLSASRIVNGAYKNKGLSARVNAAGEGWIENLRPNYDSLVGLGITLGAAKTMPNDGVLFINVRTGSQPGSQVNIYDGSGNAIGVSQHNGGSAEYHTSTFTAIVARGQSINCTHNGKGTAAIVSSYLAPWR